MDVDGQKNTQSNVNFLTFEFTDPRVKWRCTKTTIDRVADTGSSYFSAISNQVEREGRVNFFVEVNPKYFITWIAPYILHGTLPDEGSFMNGHERNCVLETAEYLGFDEIVNHLNPPPPPKPEAAFGPEVWNKFYGNVGEVPPVPDHLLKNYDDSKMLVLMPKSVDGKPFTPNLLIKIMQNPKEGGHVTRLRIPDSVNFTQYGNIAVEESYWILMTKKDIEGSNGKSLSDQLAHAQAKPYEGCRASTAFEAATCMLLWYANTEERLYNTFLSDVSNRL